MREVDNDCKKQSKRRVNKWILLCQIYLFIYFLLPMNWVMFIFHLFPNLEECKWNLDNFFSHCIFLVASQCLYEAARFMISMLFKISSGCFHPLIFLFQLYLWFFKKQFCISWVLMLQSFFRWRYDRSFLRYFNYKAVIIWESEEVWVADL